MRFALIGGGDPMLHRQMLVSLKLPPIPRTSLLLRLMLQAMLGYLDCMSTEETMAGQPLY